MRAMRNKTLGASAMFCVAIAGTSACGSAHGGAADSSLVVGGQGQSAGQSGQDPVLSLPEPPASGPLMLDRFTVKRFELVGNTVLDPTTVHDILSSFERREVGYEDLQEACQQLTRAYIERGYISSGVTLPDQEVIEGVVRLDVHESVLSAVHVNGNQYLGDDYIQARLRFELAPVMNIHDLERALKLLQQDSRIAQINGEIGPGPGLGESVLNLRIREASPRHLALSYDNHRSPSVGEDEGRVVFVDQSLTRRGDYLNGEYALTRGLDDWSVTYGVPITANDLTIEGSYVHGESDIVEAPFKELDIISRTLTWSAHVSQPLFRTLSQSLKLGVGFEKEESDSSLLSAPFSFSPGEVEGHSEVSVVRLNADWTWRQSGQVLALRGIVSKGLYALGSTDNSGSGANLPDSNFLSALLQAQYARILPWDGLQLIGRLIGQITSDPLLPVEKLAVGGAATVRGYRENQLVRDEGVIASLEMRVPVGADDSGGSRLGLALAPFIDFGLSKNKAIDLPGLDAPKSEHIASVGAGLIWTTWSWLYAELYYGKSLHDVGNEGSTLQERGIHGLARLQWSF